MVDSARGLVHVVLLAAVVVLYCVLPASVPHSLVKFCVIIILLVSLVPLYLVRN